MFRDYPSPAITSWSCLKEKNINTIYNIDNWLLDFRVVLVGVGVDVVDDHLVIGVLLVPLLQRPML